MGFVKMGLCKAGRVRCDKRKIARICEINQLGFRFHLYGVGSAADFDVDTIGEECRQPIGIVRCGIRLIFRKQPGDRTFRPRRQRNEPVRSSDQRIQCDMGHFLDRAIKMRHRYQGAKIVIARRILGIKRQPVMHCGGVSRAPGPQYTQHGADDRLDPLALAGVGKGHRPVKAVTIGDRRCGKAQRPGLLRDLLRLDRAFQHGER